jgi:hypothetical protein
MLFKEIIAVQSENHTKPTNVLCGRKVELLLTEKADGLYRLRWLEVGLCQPLT